MQSVYKIPKWNKSLQLKLITTNKTHHSPKFHSYAITGCVSYYSKEVLLGSTLCALLKVNFGNMDFHSELSASIGWHDGRGSPRLRCDLKFSLNWQHQRAMYSCKWLVTSQVHAHQIEIVIVNVNNWFTMCLSDMLVGLSGTNFWFLIIIYP